MLVFSRALNEAVRIGRDIEVKILRLGPRRVTIGVDHPADVPVCRSELAHEALPKETPPELAARVLIVEDVPVHALLIERTFLKKGVKNVVRTSAGEDALRLLELARTNPKLLPDLVLLDLMLPGISGYEVLHQIRADFGSKLIVVVVTASDNEEDYRKAMAEGANAVVSKKESYDEFRSQLASLINFWCETAYHPE